MERYARRVVHIIVHSHGCIRCQCCTSTLQFTSPDVHGHLVVDSLGILWIALLWTSLFMFSEHTCAVLLSPEPGVHSLGHTVCVSSVSLHYTQGFSKMDHESCSCSSSAAKFSVISLILVGILSIYSSENFWGWTPCYMFICSLFIWIASWEAQDFVYFPTRLSGFSKIDFNGLFIYSGYKSFLDFTYSVSSTLVNFSTLSDVLWWTVNLKVVWLINCYDG